MTRKRQKRKQSIYSKAAKDRIDRALAERLARRGTLQPDRFEIKGLGMARRKKMDHCQAKDWLGTQGVDFHKDFFVLPPSDVSRIVEAAQKTGYRKSPNAPGSRGRMYYQLLQRKRCG